jgi:hypothetical protein
VSHGPRRHAREDQGPIGAHGAPAHNMLMNNIFYIIGVVVVVMFILGYLGFR